MPQTASLPQAQIHRTLTLWTTIQYQCTLHSAQCTLHSAHCTVHSTQWQYTSQCQIISLFLYAFSTIDSACTVSGYMQFRCAVMMWRALKALKFLSHSADDAWMTKIRLAMSASKAYFSVLWRHHCSGSKSSGSLNLYPIACDDVYNIVVS